MSPYLFFSGNCKEAFEAYERIFGGRIDTMMPHAGTPAEEHVPPEWRDKIMHAHMTIGEQALMASDAPPAHSAKPQGFSVSLTFRDVNEGRRVFDALAEGGNVTMPFSPTFWAKGFGMTVDRFGTPWMINCD